MINGLRFIAAQINPTVGGLEENIEKIQKIWDDFDDKADLVLFPEMSLTGYPLEDLVLRASFMEEVHNQINALCHKNKHKSSAILIGTPWYEDKKLYNAAILIEKGNVKIVFKHDLANEGIYDEPRVFSNGPLPEPIKFRGAKIGVMICQDVWYPTVSNHLKSKGAECLIILNGSVFEIGKYNLRLSICKQRVTETNLPLLYLNLVGGQDEHVFDGDSFGLDQNGDVVFAMKSFEEQNLLIEKQSIEKRPTDAQLIYQAAMIGLRDYVLKSGFQKVLLGLSGGIDSALTAMIAVDALGVENVHCVLLPSPYTSSHSNEDALALVENLGVSSQVISIEPAMDVFQKMVKNLDGLAHENMQSRVRGLTLMTLSNQSGAFLLSTGNKSEVAVGYSTLYGDMCGAFNPLKDIYKTIVFELAVLRNKWQPGFAKGPTGSIIPKRIITKMPTAELRENQKDEDSLPPYDILDKILEGFIEDEKSTHDIISQGFDRDIVEKVYKLLSISEYKRNQSCPGANVTMRPFGGRARRYPIVNKY